MIHHLLSKFIKTLLESPDKYNKTLLSNIISNDSLISELILQKKFQTLWRESLGYSVTKESYKIINLQIKKEDGIIKAYTTILHKFILNNCPTSLESKERMEYIFIIKKDKKNMLIHELCNRETNPLFYDELATLNSATSSLDCNSRLLYLEKKIDLIKETSLSFTESSRKYKSSYIERKYSTSYNPLKSIEYARRHALNYNKSFKSFDNVGGDCTNFISQCINHGGISTTSIWKPYTHPWLRVNDLYYYLLKNDLGQDITTKKSYSSGSIVQFYANQKGFFSHSGIITKELANGDYLYCCHSYDKIDFPLSEIYPLMYDKIRIIELS